MQAQDAIALINRLLSLRLSVNPGMRQRLPLLVRPSLFAARRRRAILAKRRL
jgi:hypothetical protein